jgi:hypothetical protein
MMGMGWSCSVRVSNFQLHPHGPDLEPRTCGVTGGADEPDSSSPTHTLKPFG